MAFAVSANADDLVLVKDGVPQATIVADTNATPSYALAATELRDFVKRMSGAELPIATPGDAVKGSRILIGLNPVTEAMNLGFAQKSSIDEILEEYCVRRVGDDLVLAGNDTLEEPRKGPKGEKLDGWYSGSLFAVYDFLFGLGCRWYFPGEFGTVVPERKTIAVGDVDRRRKPAFLKHGFWTVTGFRDPARGLDSGADQKAWFVRNRYIDFSALYSNASDGSMMGPIRAAKITVDTHPTWFALNKDGTRARGHLCMSNPEVVAFLAEAARKSFRDDPTRKFIGYAPPDGMPVCWCENCKKADGNLRLISSWDTTMIPCISGSYYRLMDEVAKAVGDEFPDRKIGVSIYAGRVTPPPTFWKMQPNVVGCCAFIELSLMRPIEDPDNWESAMIRALLSSWRSRISHVTYRPYYPNFLVNLALPLPFYRNNARDTKWLHAQGVEGFIWESNPSYGTDLLGPYLRSRMMWDPAADTEAVIGEFYSTFYGPAAAPAKAFYDALEKALVASPVNGHESEFIHELYTPALVASLAPHVDAAEKAVADAGEPLATRVRMLRLQYTQLQAFSEMREAADRDYDFARAAASARRMTEAEDEMLGICPSWIHPVKREYDTRNLASQEFNGNFSSVGKHIMYRRIAALVDGVRGRMITPLPETWKFKADPFQLEGSAGQWFAPGTDISGWRDVKIGHPLEFQGISGDTKACRPFTGDAWYAVDFDVKDDFDADKAALFVGGINNEAWVWLNGEAVAYQPHHPFWGRWGYSWTHDLPKGALRPGRNRMVVRCVCNDQYGFGGIFRGIFLYENNAHGTTRAKKKSGLKTTTQDTVQMLAHGACNIEADGDDVTFFPEWTRGLGVFTLDLKDPASPVFKGGAMVPGYACGPRARSKDGKYLYYASLFSLTVFERKGGRWTPLRVLTLNFSVSDGPAKGVFVDGDRLFVKGNRTSRLFDISVPDAPVLLKAGYEPAEGEFAPPPKAAPPEVVAEQCPQKPKGGPAIVSYAETPNRKYALVRNADHDLYVFDKDGRKVASLPVITGDGRMAVTTNALYFSTGSRLCWFPLDALGKGLSPSYADFPMPKMHGRIYNDLTAGLVADGDKLYFDNAVIDISDPLNPKFVSPDGAPLTELQTGKPFLKTVEAGAVTCAIDTGHLYLLDTASGATNASFAVESPRTLDVVGGYAYVPSANAKDGYPILACNLTTGQTTWIRGALKDGVGVSTVADGLLYLADGTTVRAFDLANPLEPVEVATYAGGGRGYPPESPCRATGVAVVDGRLYVKFYSRILVFNVVQR